MVEIVGMLRASASSPTASAPSESKATTRSHFSRRTSSLPTTLERLGSDWLSLTRISTGYDLPPTFSPSFTAVRMRSIIHGVVSPKFARTPDWAPMKPILSVRDWALATLAPSAPAAEAKPRAPVVLRKVRRVSVARVIVSSLSPLQIPPGLGVVNNRGSARPRVLRVGPGRSAMGLMDFVKKQFIDILQWTEDGDDVLAWRFPVADQEIQQGAQLIVRDTQAAVFVHE